MKKCDGKDFFYWFLIFLKGLGQFGVNMVLSNSQEYIRAGLAADALLLISMAFVS